MKKILRISPLFLLILIWFIFSAPYFFQHRIPYPSKLQVSFYGPWNSYPQYQGPIKNGSLTDVVDEIYPWKHFTIDALKSGEFPFWNPNSFSGNPHFASYQSAVLTPFNLLFFVLPFIDAWALLVLFQTLLAGIFMYLFLKELDVSKPGSLISSISFMFCGFIVVWMEWASMAMAIAFLPLCLYSIEKIFNKKNNLYLILLPLGIIISFFSGHFQTSLYALGFAVIYLLYKLILTRDIQSFIRLTVCLLVGLTVTLIQIIPTIQFYNDSIRSDLFSNINGIPWFYLVTVFAPDFFGNPVTRNNWFGSYAEWAGFIGIIPFILSVLAVFDKERKNIIYFFFTTGIIALVFALNTPLLSVVLLLKIPVFATSIPSRIIVLFSFSFAALSGFGYDYLKQSLEKGSHMKVLVVFSIFMSLFFILWATLLVLKQIPHAERVIAMKNLILPSLLYFIAAVIVVFAVKINNIKIKSSILWILILLTVFDSFRFAQKWIPFDPANFIFPNVPVISAMQKDRGQGRVYGDYLAYIDTYYNIPSIIGYDPLYSKQYGEFIESSKNGTYAQALRSEVRFYPQSPNASRILDLLGVSVIYQPRSYTNQAWGYPVWEDPKRYPVIYQDSYFQLFKNTTALPRAYLFNRYEVQNSNQKLLSTFYNQDFDYRHILLLNDNPGIPSVNEMSGSARITLLNPNLIKIKVYSKSRELLFLSDTFYPSWQASVNGIITKIFRADFSFDAVVVPKGDSEVTFTYNSGLF